GGRATTTPSRELVGASSSSVVPGCPASGHPHDLAPNGAGRARARGAAPARLLSLARGEVVGERARLGREVGGPLVLLGGQRLLRLLEKVLGEQQHLALPRLEGLARERAENALRLVELPLGAITETAFLVRGHLEGQRGGRAGRAALPGARRRRPAGRGPASARGR